MTTKSQLRTLGDLLRFMYKGIPRKELLASSLQLSQVKHDNIPPLNITTFHSVQIPYNGRSW